jgi:hypothetical protein
MADPEKRMSLIKPTPTTPFKIDFDWWQENDSNWRVFLLDFLCDDHREAFAGEQNDVRLIDAVDPQTAKVTQVDGLLYELINHCAKQEGFLNENIPLVAQIFRILLANGNKPLNADQLSEKTGKPAKTILVTIGGHRVYKGIRPFLE